LGQPMCCKVTLFKPLQKHTKKSNTNLFFMYRMLQLTPRDCYVLKNFVFAKTSSILEIFINFILYLLKTNIPTIKLKMFFPLVFQTTPNHVNVFVHNNIIQ
jgi:hypothetical protein